MIFAVDCDDVLIDLMSEWIYRHNKDFDSNLKKEDITDWDISKFSHPSCGKNIYKYIEDPSIYDYCKPIENSLKGIEHLRTLGRVIFVTSWNVGIAGRKYTWLKDHGYIDSINDYFEAHDKNMIKFNCLIDDGPHNFPNLYSGFLFTQPWNKNFNHYRRINNWEEFINMKVIL